jgi:hypothetical protein
VLFIRHVDVHPTSRQTAYDAANTPSVLSSNHVASVGTVVLDYQRVHDAVSH